MNIGRKCMVLVAMMSLLLWGCAKQVPPSTPVSELEKPVSTGAPVASTTVQFGDERWGFSWTYSENGRFVVLYLFDSETEPTFGQHGEPMGPDPKIIMYDLASQTNEEIQDVLFVSNDWLVIKQQDQWHRINTVDGTKYTLDKASQEEDNNLCLGTRLVSFSGKGNRLGWINQDSTGLHVVDLETGEQWMVPAQDKLWRGWPDSEGKGAVFLEVSKDATSWPKQQTSCACLWCKQFAMAYGVYGWGGPSFLQIHVLEDGTREFGTLEDPEETTSKCTVSPKKEGDMLARGPWTIDCAE